MKKILILEDNPERTIAFEHAVKLLGPEYSLKAWPDALVMMAECEELLEPAALISLKHDLDSQPGATRNPGTGLDAAKFLTSYPPLCPVLIHSINTDRAWSMHNELRFAGWAVERIGPIGEDWVQKAWLPTARELLARPFQRVRFQRPADHQDRLARALLSLDGLAIGDALGEMLAYRYAEARHLIFNDRLPAGPWIHTDDTEMALSIFEVLRLLGYVDQDALARRFAGRFEREPDRGYGKMTRIQLREVLTGGDWRQLASSAFSGQGSMGNGGAMRVAPLGAYWADNLEQVVEQARASATVTHTHPEGIAGTIAVAVASATAWQLRNTERNQRPAVLFDTALQHTPTGATWRGIQLASQIPPDLPIESVVKALGNGSQVTAPDTVPFALWCAAHHVHNYADAIATAISGGGDCDTNAAIVGGIVALSTGADLIPEPWKKAKEPLFSR